MNNHFTNNRYSSLAILFIVLIALFYTAAVYARAGGGGGSSSGGSGGDGGDLIALLFYIIMMIPFPWNFLVIGLIILLAWWGNKKSKQQTILNQLPQENMTDRQNKVARYKQINPTFDPALFKGKVRQAFIEIQEAWMIKDMKKVRKYISDGMYQRLNIQFKMMNILDQKNIIEKLLVKNIFIDKIEYDGKFDIIHAAIQATIVDKFVSPKYPHLNSGGAEEFVEYWTFIKKRGIKESNLFNTQNCPNCGAELPANAGDVSQCSYCKTITNLGDYDWVLSEITQADDYISAYRKASKESALAMKVNELAKTNPDFSVQNIEDKASNGYLQIITARALHEPAIMRRFVSDELYQKLSAEENEKIVFNRIFLNDVTLIRAGKTTDKNILAVSIKSSYQRVLLRDGKAQLIDSAVTAMRETVIMSRDINPKLSKGSLYAHVCPSCAGPVKDTIDTKCLYCGATLNSTSNEWIITDILSVPEYREYFKENKHEMIGGIDIDKLDSMYDVRDYAFNNMLVVMAADGKFESEEEEMAVKVAKKWGYRIDKIAPMFKMAASGTLVIRMPEDQKKRQKIFRLMDKAASIDGVVSPEEKELLDSVKKMYITAA